MSSEVPNELMDKVVVEVDTLITFWLTHDCKNCEDDFKTRMPTMSFPALFELLKERRKP